MAKDHHTIIGGYPLTLFYDLDKETLPKLTEDQKIEWFRQRTESLFVLPLKKLFCQKSSVFSDLNKDAAEDKYPEFQTFMMAQFSVLLNGIECLGSFISKSSDSARHSRRSRYFRYFFPCSDNDNEKKSRNNFLAYVEKYLGQWRKQIKSIHSRDRYVPSILWKDYRNALTHGLAIKNHGIEYHDNNQRIKETGQGSILINPLLFFEDFLGSFSTYVNDIRCNQGEKEAFLTRFHQLYPQ